MRLSVGPHIDPIGCGFVLIPGLVVAATLRPWSYPLWVAAPVGLVAGFLVLPTVILIDGLIGSVRQEIRFRRRRKKFPSARRRR